MAEELPNLGVLIKLLKMTTSANDAEALVAVRKANEALKKFGGDWEALLRGKVTVIGDPFDAIDAAPKAPAPPSAAPKHAPPPPPSPRPTPRAPQPPPPPQKPYWQTVWAKVQKPNIYAGSCVGCSTRMGVGAATITVRVGGGTGFGVACPACAGHLPDAPKTARTTQRKASMQDLKDLVK